MSDPASFLLPPHFWTVLCVCLLAFAALWWKLQGAHRFARRRRLRQRIAAVRGDAGADTKLATREPLRRLPRGMSATARRHGPPHATPRFLFIGDDAADVAGLLSAAADSAARGPSSTRDAPWHKLELDTMVAVGVDPRLFDDGANRQARLLWFRSLLTLCRERPRLPLNGLALCIDATRLLREASSLAAHAARLRVLADEASACLWVDPPVYLIVTGLERLDGYALVRAALPEDIAIQAIGRRTGDDAASALPSGEELEHFFAELDPRLQALRAALLRAQRTAAEREAFHIFVERIRALEPGLRILVEELFGHSHGRAPPHAPRWRGIYLTASPTTESAGAFITDLFARFLPADQPLARTWHPDAAFDAYLASMRT